MPDTKKGGIQKPERLFQTCSIQPPQEKTSLRTGKLPSKIPSAKFFVSISEKFPDRHDFAIFSEGEFKCLIG
jgi:hypothetical protein